MRLKYLELEGVTCFDSKVEVPFEKIGPGLIAIIGKNGRGKTTILEASGPGVLHLEMPTRPSTSLAGCASPAGGRILLDATAGGRQYQFEVQIDKHGSTSGFLRRDGESLVSGKVRDYQAKVAEIFGTKEAYYASVFGCQGGAGKFARLDIADRKAVFRYFLGLERIERLHVAAKSRLAAIDMKALEAAQERDEELTRILPGLRQEIARTERAAEEAKVAWGEVLQRLQDVQKLAALQKLVEAYDRALDDAAEADEEITRLEKNGPPPAPASKCPVLAGQEKALEEARKRHDEVRQLQRKVDSASRDATDAQRLVDQAKRQTGVLKRVPCKGVERYSTCEFLCDAQAAAKSLPGLGDTQKTVTAVAVTLRQDYQKLLASLPDVAALERALVAARQVRERWLAQKQASETHGVRLEAANRVFETARERALKLQAELPEDVPEDLPGEAEVVYLRRQVDITERASHMAALDAARAVAAEESACRERDRADKEVARLRRTTADVSPLQLLVRALGPEGVQGYEVEAAGPRVSALANGLLEAAFGSRFQIGIRPLRELKTREGMTEDYRIRVYDDEREGERDLGSFSGGEQTIVDEALRTAFSIFSAEQLPIKYETLWRDELSSPLDAENREGYLMMLRRALDLGGFHQILYVTHEPTLAESADAVIHVGKEGHVSWERR